MKHIDLFSGIGGFALAARWMGWETIQFVEIDKFCHKILTKNFPNVPIHGDIKTFDGSHYRGTVDILTGGFPCQPFSVAGSRKGKKDDRHVWPEMLRTISEIKPSWVVGENVTGIIGLALDQVLTEMEGEGYNTETYIIPACAVNAPHRRDRIWILAYSESNRDRRISRAMEEAPIAAEKQKDGMQLDGKSQNGISANPSSNGLQGLSPGPDIDRENESLPRRSLGGIFAQTNATNSHSREQSFSGKIGRMGWSESIQGNRDWEITSEPFVRRGTHGLSNRMDRIKSLGNAIVPQVAFEIFKAIELVDIKTKGSAKIAQPDHEQSEVEKQ